MFRDSFRRAVAAHCSSEGTTSIIDKSGPVAYWRRINDALVEAGEPPLASSEAYDFYKTGHSSEDALIVKLFAPNNLRLGIRARLWTGRSGQRDQLIQFKRPIS